VEGATGSSAPLRFLNKAMREAISAQVFGG
jgi:hypothetical protein